jgi:hypothetical protein
LEGDTFSTIVKTLPIKEPTICEHMPLHNQEALLITYQTTEIGYKYMIAADIFSRDLLFLSISFVDADSGEHLIRCILR